MEHAFTTGLNPFFRRVAKYPIAIRLELPEAFSPSLGYVYFYGAGCSSKEKRR